MRGGLVACLLVLARVARADEVDDLVAQGEALAKQAEWTRAITAFKAADAKRPRAKHACLIGLAYTRRELWAQAELFLGVCRQRATADDPAPDWLADAEKTLAEKLAAAGAAPVTITVEPASAISLVHVSSFAPDEAFPPRTIHLPPGTHSITVTAPDYKPAKRDVTIESGEPRTIQVVLAPVHVSSPSDGSGSEHHGSRVPLYLLAAAGAIAAGGLAYDELALQPARDRIDLKSFGQVENTPTSAYDTFHDRQLVTIGLFAGAAAVAATAVILHFTRYREPEAVHVGARVAPGGATLTLELAL